METVAAQRERVKRKLDKFFNQQETLFAARSKTPQKLCEKIAKYLIDAFDHDYSEIIEFVHLHIHWPLAFRIHLVRTIKHGLAEKEMTLSNITRFVFHPKKNLEHGLSVPTVASPIFLPGVASIDRHFGSAVSTILRLKSRFFLINLLTLVIWLSSITIPFEVLSSSKSFSNVSFDFASIFTAEGYLAETMLFQGFYPNVTLKGRYDLPLIYLITSYVYYIVWFVFLTVSFSRAYKRKLLKTVLSKNSGQAFQLAFSRYDYTIQSEKAKQKIKIRFKRQFQDVINDDERTRLVQDKAFKTLRYKLAVVITNIFYLVLCLASGALNWLILSRCNESGPGCYQSVIVLVIINRFLPYFIAGLSQIEQYKYQSYKIDVVGFRLILLYMCTMLSFIIYFFVHAPTCYETAFGQFIYVLSLAEMFASLVVPLVFGFLCDLIALKAGPNLDGINIQVQLSLPSLLYAHFLIWIGIYYGPFIPILTLINIIFSYASHTAYFYIRSISLNSALRVLAWNAQRLEYVFYLLAYILLIFSITCFTVFTTQLSPSDSCGPFRSFNHSYDVITNYLNDYPSSVLWITIIDYLRSTGFIYFLAVLFFFISFKFRQEGLAEKELLFIRENNLESKKKVRKTAVKRLIDSATHTTSIKSPTYTTEVETDDDDNQLDQSSHF